MSLAKTIEVIASSPNGFEDAIKSGIARANESLDRVEGAWVKDQEVILDDGKIKEYRVRLALTFVVK